MEELIQIRDINSADLSKELIINLNNKLTDKDIIIISAISKLKNPFKMIGVEMVMKDLNICRGVAYKIFQRKDFPSVNIGKAKQVMLISYLLWKIDKKEW